MVDRISTGAGPGPRVIYADDCTAVVAILVVVVVVAVEATVD